MDKALSMAATYARANVIVAGGEFVVASTIMAFFCRALYSGRKSGKDSPRLMKSASQIRRMRIRMRHRTRAMRRRRRRVRLR